MTRPYPRLYNLTTAQRAALSPAERSAIYDEYSAYWNGRESHSNRTEQSDYQKDRDEDRFGTYR